MASPPPVVPGTTGALGLVPKSIPEEEKKQDWHVAKVGTHAEAIEILSRPVNQNITLRYLYYNISPLDSTLIQNAKLASGTPITTITKQFELIWRSADLKLKSFPRMLFSDDTETNWYLRRTSSTGLMLPFVTNTDLTNAINDWLITMGRTYRVKPLDKNSTEASKMSQYQLEEAIVPGRSTYDITTDLGFAPDKNTAEEMVLNTQGLYSIYKNEVGSIPGKTRYVLLYNNAQKKLMQIYIEVNQEDGKLKDMARPVSRSVDNLKEFLSYIGIGQLGAASKHRMSQKDEPGSATKQLLPDQSDMISSLKRTIVARLRYLDSIEDIPTLRAILDLITKVPSGADAQKYLKYKQKYLQLKYQIQNKNLLQ